MFVATLLVCVSTVVGIVTKEVVSYGVHTKCIIDDNQFPYRAGHESDATTTRESCTYLCLVTDWCRTVEFKQSKFVGARPNACELYEALALSSDWQTESESNEYSSECIVVKKTITEHTRRSLKTQENDLVESITSTRSLFIDEDCNRNNQRKTRDALFGTGLFIIVIICLYLLTSFVLQIRDKCNNKCQPGLMPNGGDGNDEEEKGLKARRSFRSTSFDSSDKQEKMSSVCFYFLLGFSLLSGIILFSIGWDKKVACNDNIDGIAPYALLCIGFILNFIGAALAIASWCDRCSGIHHVYDKTTNKILLWKFVVAIVLFLLFGTTFIGVGASQLL